MASSNSKSSPNEQAQALGDKAKEEETEKNKKRSWTTLSSNSKMPPNERVFLAAVRGDPKMSPNEKSFMKAVRGDKTKEAEAEKFRKRSWSDSPNSKLNPNEEAYKKALDEKAKEEEAEMKRRRLISRILVRPEVQLQGVCIIFREYNKMFELLEIRDVHFEATRSMVAQSAGRLAGWSAHLVTRNVPTDCPGMEGRYRLFSRFENGVRLSNINAICKSYNEEYRVAILLSRGNEELTLNFLAREFKCVYLASDFPR